MHRRRRTEYTLTGSVSATVLSGRRLQQYLAYDTTMFDARLIIPSARDRDPRPREQSSSWGGVVRIPIALVGEQSPDVSEGPEVPGRQPGPRGTCHVCNSVQPASTSTGNLSQHPWQIATSSSG